MVRFLLQSTRRRSSCPGTQIELELIIARRNELKTVQPMVVDSYSKSIGVAGDVPTAAVATGGTEPDSTCRVW